jgi:hypothetical protein
MRQNPLLTEALEATINVFEREKASIALDRKTTVNRFLLFENLKSNLEGKARANTEGLN